MIRALGGALLVAASSAVCLALLACPALAGSYTINACSPSTSPGLWAPVNTFPTSYTTANNCGGPSGSEIGPLDGSNHGALYAEDTLLTPDMPDGSRAGWTFTAPTGTTITTISYYRSLAAYGQRNFSAGLVQADGVVLEECRIQTPLGSSIVCSKPNDQGPVTFTGLNTSSLFFGVICRVIFPDGGGCVAGGTIHAGSVSVYSARVTLSESSTPGLGGLSGALWEGGVVSGVVPVKFSASDPTGIRQAYVRADAGGVIAGATQTCDSMLAQPCPQLPDGSLSVDTRRAGDGPRTFTVVVVDAAGNQQSATSAPIVVRNQAPTVAPPTIAPLPPPPSSTAVSRTRIRAVIEGRRLRVTGSIARSGRVRVSWRSKRRGRTLAHGSRIVTIRQHKVVATFMLSRRARAGTTRIAVRSGRRIVAQARARRG
jgi:hypothetical protein